MRTKIKQKGFSITLEAMLAALLMTLMLNLCVYVINVQSYEKTMYEAFITTCIQVSRWGGTSSNIYPANGRSANIIFSMRNELEKQGVESSTFTLTAYPRKVTESNPYITIRITWKDPDFMGFSGGSKSLTIKTKAIVSEGKLL